MSLGLQPGEFWRLSALEWRWLTSAGEKPMTAGEAQALARLYPD